MDPCVVGVYSLVGQTGIRSRMNIFFLRGECHAGSLESVHHLQKGKKLKRPDRSVPSSAA